MYINLKQGHDNMKNSLISVAAVIALSSFGFAGGDIEPVEPVVDTPMVEASAGNAYVGLAFALVNTRDSSVDLDFFSGTAGADRLGNITFLAGYNFNSYIGVEGRYTTGVSNSDIVSMDGWSLFLKPQYPVSNAMNIYALLGYGGVTMDPENNSLVNVDDTGFQWGIGADYAVTEQVSIFVDYTSLASDMDGVYANGALNVDADALTVGVTYAF